ncbi:protein O-glucosyltransferase 2-like isoform X2 [Macrosteles quadrilineatus]|uniref:protein O-glucosyltransferase 2-like isoform X2 n=1 Tax=Macrosteles quadrilineatus TaxID=74068 RepID=UPI0023E321B7|nr:protein O-glucosyltransferase 2-like isoform X2 [Macrosteles quadrilineatus]
MDFLHLVGMSFTCLAFVSSSECSSKPNKVNVHGPGLKPDSIVMPARYFFVTIIEKSQRHEQPVLEHLKVDINGKNIYQRNCRVWTNILDRKDGSFIVRYKLYETCYDMEISVKYEGNDVEGSPIIVEGVVQPDDCYCPSSLQKWLKDYNCPKSYAQIEHDLQPFSTVDFTEFHDHVVSSVNNSGSMSVCNYVIRNNQIYRKCYGQHVGFKMFMDATLSSLARKVKLPDTEIFVNLGDWPLVQKAAEKIFPMFSWCGSRQSLDIVMPTYDITESSLEAMGRVSLDMLSVQGNIDLPWSEREQKAFWRGRDSSRERLKLIEIARKHPDLFNASMTNFFFFRDVEHIYGPKEKHVSFFDFFKYRYQVSVDGTVAAYRLPYLLAGGSLVLKQDSHYYEHFYGELTPWEHYVPVKRDLSDLVERVQWALDNDEEAHKIAVNGQKYARENLLPDHIFCYHIVLLKEWARRLQGNVEVREGMEKVPQTENKNCVCPQLSEIDSKPSHEEL